MLSITIGSTAGDGVTHVVTLSPVEQSPGVLDAAHVERLLVGALDALRGGDSGAARERAGEAFALLGEHARRPRGGVR